MVWRLFVRCAPECRSNTPIKCAVKWGFLCVLVLGLPLDAISHVTCNLLCSLKHLKIYTAQTIVNVVCIWVWLQWYPAVLCQPSCLRQKPTTELLYMYVYVDLFRKFKIIVKLCPAGAQTWALQSVLAIEALLHAWRIDSTPHPFVWMICTFAASPVDISHTEGVWLKYYISSSQGQR